MCGIAGIFNFCGQDIDEHILRRMTTSLAHRGPDGDGFYLDGNVGFGHRRLKIIDLSEHGSQPMCNEDRSIWVTYNGEIYNFKALRADLIGKGHVFKSRSDTEVIIHAYEEWGIACIEKFNGMFAFALYDSIEEELFLVRDRLGIKPLFYHISSKSIFFASEIKAILEHPEVNRKINFKGLHNYLSLYYSTAPFTAFADIVQLLPGHYLKALKNGSKTVIRYWKASFVYDRADKKNQKEWLEEFDAKLHTAVKRRLVSDVPFGAFLSGGLDSSSIVYYMKALIEDVRTFSIGFYEKSFNELDDAHCVSRYLGTHQHSKQAVPQIDETLVKKMVFHSEEPTADPSFIPTYFLSSVTSDHVKMALAGDGADEILAGYETYQAHYLRTAYHMLPSFIRNQMIKRIVHSLPVKMSKVSLDYKLKAFVSGAELPWQESHMSWREMYSEEMKRFLYEKSVQDQVGSYATFDAIKPYFEEARGSKLNKMLEVDTRFYLPNDMLTKVDRASMAHSLEVRLPFLDHELVEFVGRMPENLKLRHFYYKKAALKKIMIGKLPKPIINKKKQGFFVPVNQWILGPLKEFVLDTLSAQNIKEMGIFNPVSVTWIIEQHLKKKKDFGYHIWCLVFLVVWWKMFFKKTIVTG